MWSPRTAMVLGATLAAAVVLTLGHHPQPHAEKMPNKGTAPCAKGHKDHKSGPAKCRRVCAVEEGAGGHCSPKGECICSGSYGGSSGSSGGGGSGVSGSYKDLTAATSASAATQSEESPTTHLVFTESSESTETTNSETT